MARPSKIHDVEVVDQIERAVRAGASLRDAAGSAGINPGTLTRWLSRGRTHLNAVEAARDRGEQYEVPADDEPFRAFCARMERAEHEAKVEALAVIRRAIVGWEESDTRIVEKAAALLDAEGQPVLDDNGDVRMVVVSRTTTTTTGRKFAWAAAMTWLERRYPAEFARLVRTELTGADGGPVEVLSMDEERAKALDVLDQVKQRRDQRAIAAARAIEGSGAG